MNRAGLRRHQGTAAPWPGRLEAAGQATRTRIVSRSGGLASSPRAVGPDPFSIPGHPRAAVRDGGSAQPLGTSNDHSRRQLTAPAACRPDGVRSCLPNLRHDAPPGVQIRTPRTIGQARRAGVSPPAYSGCRQGRAPSRRRCPAVRRAQTAMPKAACQPSGLQRAGHWPPPLGRWQAVPPT